MKNRLVVSREYVVGRDWYDCKWAVQGVFVVMEHFCILIVAVVLPIYT